MSRPRRNLSYPLHAEAPVVQGWGDNKRLYRPYGLEYGHNGLDLGVVSYTPVLAMIGGTVAFAGDGADNVVMGGGAGLCVLTEHKGYALGYAHLSRLFVKDGQRVQRGQVIALSGNTGATSGAHLHVERLPLPLDMSNGFLGREDIEPYLQPALGIGRKSA